MLAISIGPVALPLPPLLLLGAVWLAQFLAARLARRPRAGDGSDDAPTRGRQAADAITTAALLGLLAARLAFVALQAPAYLESPLSVLDIRDGGWHAGAGWTAGGAWLAWRAWGRPALRRALAAGAVAGTLAWALAGLAVSPGHGRPVPEIALQPLDGSAPVTLAQQLQGQPAVVVLWATWCAPCRAEMPLLAAAQQRETAVRFVFVNQGEDPAVVRRHLASLPFPVRQVLLDPPSALGPAVGSPGLPTTLFYDANGRQQHAHFGMLNAASLESRLRPLRPAPGR